MIDPKAGGSQPGTEPLKTGGDTVDVLMVLCLEGRILSIRPPEGLNVLNSRGPWEGRYLHEALSFPASGQVRQTLEESVGSGSEKEICFRAETVRGQEELILAVLPHLEEGTVFASLKTAGAVYRPSDSVADDLRVAGRILDNLADGVMIVDRHMRVVFVNAEMCRSLGYTRDEFIGKHISEVEVDFGAKGRGEIFPRLISGENITVHGVHRRKDGSTFPIEARMGMSLIGGEKLVVVTARDISAMKETESRLRTSLKEKEILLKEVYHRVKNNLQVVSGLLNLQAHSIEDSDVKQIFRDSQNRILTMALIHEELYRARDLTRLDFHQYIRRLVENLVKSHGVSPERVGVHMDLEEVEVVVDTAIPVGLVINEILSNALEHAFPGKRKGKVRITLRSREPSSFCLQVEDDGVGLPEDFDPMKTRSLGLRIVHMICEQLGGDLTVKSEGGTSFGLTFPEYHEAGTQLY